MIVFKLVRYCLRTFKLVPSLTSDHHVVEDVCYNKAKIIFMGKTEGTV